MAAIFDTYGYIQENTDIGPFFCMSEPLTLQDIADRLTAYLRNHPESRQYNAPSTLLAALDEAWPCF